MDCWEPDFELALSSPVAVAFGVALGDSLDHLGVLEPDVCVSFVVTRREVPDDPDGCLLAKHCKVERTTRSSRYERHQSDIVSMV